MKHLNTNSLNIILIICIVLASVYLLSTLNDQEENFAFFRNRRCRRGCRGCRNCRRFNRMNPRYGNCRCGMYGCYCGNLDYQGGWYW